MHRTVLVSTVAGVLIAAGAPLAAAAPPEQEVIPLVCDNGEAYDVVVTGNGEFTPGRITSSTGVVIPIAFGDFFFRAVDPETGELLVEGSFPGGEGKGKGNVQQRNPRPTTTCSFEQTEVLEEEDPDFELPAGTEVTFGGEVTVFVTPMHR